MFRRSEKIWKYFPQGIMATDTREATLLRQLLLLVALEQQYLPVTEILDYQRYRIIKKRALVRKMLSLSEEKTTFLFPFCKN